MLKRLTAVVGIGIAAWASIGPAADTRPANRGGKIVFVRDVRERPACQIAVVNGDGSRQHGLASFCRTTGGVSWPTWSPNGSRIAYIRSRPLSGGDASLWVMRADGTRRRKVLGVPSPVGLDTPSWSPDGLRIAFGAQNGGVRDPASGAIDVYVVNVGGDGLQNVTQNKRCPGPPAGLWQHVFYWPDWSPDGRRIAFERGDPCAPQVRGDEGLGLFVQTLETGEVTQLTSGDAGHPAWSPNGRKIAFEHLYGLATVNADGSGERVIRRTLRAQTPTWAPNGRTIAFVKRRKLYTVSANGGPVRRLGGRNIVGAYPDWSR
jgi:TolB protein